MGFDTVPVHLAFLDLHTQSRVESHRGKGDWHVVEETVRWDPRKTAAVVVDMWDKHHDLFKARNVDMLARHMNRFLKEARARGVTILHGPSDVMDFYKDHPARKNVLAAPETQAPKKLTEWMKYEDWELQYYSAMETGVSESPILADRSPWTRQNQYLEILPEDGISDNGQEVYNFFNHKGIENILIMGVHTNWCVLGRPFGIRQWAALNKLGGKWKVALVRDLTETGVGVGDPVTIDGKPGQHMSHDHATDLIVEHIERFWAPSILSRDVYRVPPPRPKVLLKNEFDDESLFYDEKGPEDFEIGGGFYNMSSNHDWKAVGGASAESEAAQERDNVLALKAVEHGSIAAVISRACFGFKGAEYPKGTAVSWTIRKIEARKSLESGGLSLGVIDADGPLGTPVPARLDARQFYVNLKGGGGSGPMRGEVLFSLLGNKTRLGAPFTFPGWSGRTPLGVELVIHGRKFSLTFSEKLSLGTASIQGELPQDLAADLVNVFATFQGPRGAGAELERVAVSIRE